MGQTLRGDDGAGIEAVQAWEAAHPDTASRPEIQVENVELPGLSLLDLLRGFPAAIIVDAVQSGAPAGTLHLIAPANLEAFAPSSKSAHGWGAAEALRLGRQLDPQLNRAEICVIGIEAEQFGIGSGLSKVVREALPLASAAIEDQVQKILQRQQA